MASRNPDASIGSDPNGFHASKPRNEPLTTHGHQVGKQVGNDAVPEFSAEILPAGTAPADRTFKPNNANEVPQGGASAADTIGGATSGDVHQGLGQPIQGQSSAELRHDGQSHRKNPGTGLDGLLSGATGKTVDPHLPENANQRAQDKEEAVIGRGNVGGPAAQDRVPETAEGVASERK